MAGAIQAVVSANVNEPGTTVTNAHSETRIVHAATRARGLFVDAGAGLAQMSIDVDRTDRNEMQALIDAETPQPERRSRMIASFNRGYRGYQQTYRTCTPAADLVIRRYLEEGSKLIRDVTARYAN